MYKSVHKVHNMFGFTKRVINLNNMCTKSVQKICKKWERKSVKKGLKHDQKSTQIYKTCNKSIQKCPINKY